MRFSIQAYRKTRQRSLEDCIGDTMELFTDLQKIDGEIFKWKNLAKSKKTAMRNPYLDFSDRDLVKRLLLAGRNRTDTTKEVIEDLGYHLSFWNGSAGDDLSAQISFSNGGYSKFVGNVLYLEFPDFGDIATDDAHAAHLITVCINALDADWAMLCRTEVFYDEKREKPFLDRGIFLSQRHRIRQLFATVRWSRSTTSIATALGKIYLAKQSDERS
jgi:hypothetical protein